MPDALWLVVCGQGQDQPHDGLQVALEDLLGRDLVHPDPLGRHELEDALQVLPHAVDGLGVVLDPGDLLPGDDLNQLGQDLARLQVGPQILDRPQVRTLPELRVDPGDVGLQLLGPFQPRHGAGHGLGLLQVGSRLCV